MILRTLIACVFWIIFYLISNTIVDTYILDKDKFIITFLSGSTCYFIYSLILGSIKL